MIDDLRTITLSDLLSRITVARKNGIANNPELDRLQDEYARRIVNSAGGVQGVPGDDQDPQDLLL